jgi:hypothetical protein
MTSMLRRFGGPGAAALLLVVATSPGAVRSDARLEVVATGVSRPLQLAVDGRTLVVLGPGQGGDSAGDIYRLDLDADTPVDLSRQPRLRIAFADARMGSLGSLAIDPRTHDLLLGEENGRRVYRLSARGQLTLYATGLRRLSGGSAIAFDRLERLVLVDYADPRTSPSEEVAPPGLEQLRDEDYRGPLVFRLTHDDTIPLPRHLNRLAPLFPRAWGGRAGGAMLPHLISVAPLEGDEIAFLTSGGEIFRLTADGRFHAFARLPRGQYNRTSMVALPDGALVVSGGFHVGSIFQVAPDGSITTLASGLADPEGIAVDDRGDLYIAESAFHRLLRLRHGVLR